MTGANYLGTGYTAPISNFETDPSNQNRIMHIVHSVADSDYAAVLDKTRQENAALFYITDDAMTNPYDALPTNFSTLHSDATPVSTEGANSNDQAGLADTGVSAIMLALIGAGTLLVGTALALTLLRRSR